jgi:hypothetical protein
MKPRNEEAQAPEKRLLSHSKKKKPNRDNKPSNMGGKKIFHFMNA